MLVINHKDAQLVVPVGSPITGFGCKLIVVTEREIKSMGEKWPMYLQATLRTRLMSHADRIITIKDDEILEIGRAKNPLTLRYWTKHLICKINGTVKRSRVLAQNPAQFDPQNPRQKLRPELLQADCAARTIAAPKVQNNRRP